MPDITDTIAPDSDQLDAIDLVGGERTFTITRVDINPTAEQPATIHLAEFDRPWKPGKSMRRVLARCWGKSEGGAYEGRRVTLYCDSSVTFGKEKVGGTRIKALSHIDGRQSFPLLVSRGKSATYTVEPLPDAPTAATEPSPEELAEQVAQGIKDATDEAEIREWGNRAHARNLLDVQVDGQVLRDHVTDALAALEQRPDADVPQQGETGGE